MKDKFKKIIFLFSCCFLFSCNQQIRIKNTLKIETPDFIVLSDLNKQPLGRAFLVSKNIGIAPDHLYEVSNELFYENEKIEILARDFENDILAFKVEKENKVILELSNMPPDIGKQVYWFDGKQKISNILAVGVEFKADFKKKRNLISFSGEALPGASGGIVFDENQKVWGMIIGADVIKKEIFAVRSDVIKQFVKEIEK